MRITSDKDIQEIKDKGRKSSLKKSDSSFADILESESDRQSVEKLRRLLDDVEKSGKDLAYFRTSDSLRRYKEQVKYFVGELLKHYKSKVTKGAVEKDGREKIYHLVEQINGRLESFTEEALSSMKSSADIMAALEEIRGLMVDTFA
ncbi:MAG: DUF327 family protein [Candidatus Wallbacteria bacterium]|nr:DUF327 family protein [Candidatus Wallbacteria bacterium]